MDRRSVGMKYSKDEKRKGGATGRTEEDGRTGGGTGGRRDRRKEGHTKEGTDRRRNIWVA